MNGNEDIFEQYLEAAAFFHDWLVKQIFEKLADASPTVRIPSSTLEDSAEVIVVSKSLQRYAVFVCLTICTPVVVALQN